MKKKMKQSRLVFLLNTASIVMLVLIGVLTGLNGVIRLQLNGFNTARYDLTANANRFMNGSATLTNMVRSYAATGDKQFYDGYMNELNTDKNRDIGLANMRDIGLTAEEEALIAEMSALSDKLVPLETNAMDSVSKGQSAAAIDYVYGKDYAETLAMIAQDKAKFMDLIDRRTLSEVESLTARSTAIYVGNALLIIAIIVMQVLNYRLIKKQVITPVIRIRDQMLEIAGGKLSSAFDMDEDNTEIGMLVGSIHHTKAELKRYIEDISNLLSQMSRGNMDQRVEIDYQGDFAPIKDSLSGILQSLNHTLSQIDDSAAIVSQYAGEVAAGSDTLAQGSTEQAATVQELSATVRGLVQRMQQIAEQAGGARDASFKASGALTLGNEKMQELSHAMDEIEHSSQQIGNIIKTIEDIAFQTNILALNAAVEAARAGSAGKGFAVVADEVRNLATSSSEAAHKTAALISRSMQAVSRGTALAHDTASALNDVVESAQVAADYASQIAESSSKQAVALKQVDVGISQIADVTQCNAGTAEESAAASRELDGQAGTLKQLADRFELRHG